MLKKIERHHIWLGCMIAGPLIAFLSVYDPAYSVLAITLIIIGLIGVLRDIM